MQAEFAQIEKPPPQRKAARQAGGLPRNGAGHAARPFLFSLSLSLMDESWYFIFKRVILSCAHHMRQWVQLSCGQYCLCSRSFEQDSSELVGEEMNPQLPVKVNSALLNGMQQYVLITRLFKASPINHMVSSLPPPPLAPRPSLSRSGTTLPLLLSETRLSPKAPRVSGRELGWVGSLRMQIRVRNRAATDRNWMRRLKARNDLASGPLRSPQHHLRSGATGGGGFMIGLSVPPTE